MIHTTDLLITELVALKRVQQIQRPRDERLYCPTDNWLERFGKFLIQTNPPFKAQKMDCDDFAVRAVDRATEALNDVDAIKDCGHAVCICEITLPMFGADGGRSPGYFGIQETLSTHMTNMVRTTTGWKFFEPQCGGIIDAKTAFDTRAVGTVLWIWL